MSRFSLQTNDPVESARAVLRSDDRTMRRLVRTVAAETSIYADAIFTLAVNGEWRGTPQQWKTVVERVDNLGITVEEWLSNADSD